MKFHSNKYPKLNDSNWLFEEYVIKKKSTVEIANNLGIKASNSVREALLSNNINLRSCSESLRVHNDNFMINTDVIVGSLLGDAYLCKWNKESIDSMPYFGKKNKYLDHVELVAKAFYGDTYNNYIKKDVNKCNGKLFTYWKFKTSSSESLVDYYEKWYPTTNNRKKLIPKDIKLTPEIILHWFMDDGSSSWRTRNGILTKQVKITFSSQSFTKEDNDFLVNEINTEFSLKSRVSSTNSGTGWVITIPQSKSFDFFDLIGLCPIESMKYKWKR
ncbi:MAG: hypothetical protein M0R17_04125 [Candidatus Omnitrophica bacterium]|jgi:hypothetical protein|nr:hypothetical protein [Candidatus Omnitrophota bacterium]